MKALVYMGPEVLSFQDMPDPQPERGEVLIKVAGQHACCWLGRCVCGT